MVLLGWGEVGAVVHPGFRGGQRRILGAGAWGRGFLVKLASWRILLDLGGGTVRGTSDPPPLPLHLLGLPGIVEREEEFARMGLEMEGREGASPGCPRCWRGGGRPQHLAWLWPTR